MILNYLLKRRNMMKTSGINLQESSPLDMNYGDFIIFDPRCLLYAVQ